MKVFYPFSGVVSVWVGTFPSEQEFDSYLDGPLKEALGLQRELASICEVFFQDKPGPVEEVLEGFSGYGSFIDKAVEVAKVRGIDLANAALVCYYVKCEGAAETWGKLHFLGSFKGQDVCGQSL